MKKIVIGMVIIALGCGVWFGKLHRTREVEVVTCVDNIVTVQHPNTLFYQFETIGTYEYKQGDKIKVVFDELTDWEKNYRIVDVVE